MALRMSKRLQKEYESIQKNNQDMKVLLPNNDLTLWHVNFQGAKGTLYEGESFTLQLRFANEYVPLPHSAHRVPRSHIHRTHPRPRAHLLQWIHLSFHSL
jgi:hypothetical protein